MLDNINLKNSGIQRKALISTLILTIGLMLTVLVGTGPVATLYQSQGTAIDFGSYEVTWTDMDLTGVSDPYDTLKYACSENSYDYTIDDNGIVTMINGISSDNNHSWDLWVVVLGETKWTRLSAPYDTDLSKYTISSWAYTANGKTPTVGVDSAGNSIYGYSQISSTISLSPSITEMICSIGGINTLIGTDRYSNYPEEVVELQNKGDIAIVGDYTTPVYESIVKVEPDIVYCDSSQYNHISLNNTLRNMSIVSVLLYEGTGTNTILDNIYIIGHTMGYDLGSDNLIDDMIYCMDKISSENHHSADIMAALSPDAATWVAGSYTYFNDAISGLGCTNVFKDYFGWVHINPEMITISNPSYIVIVTSSFSATQEDYDYILGVLSSEWKSTDAYRNGNIYVICEEAADMAQRAGPRNIQLMELLSLIIDPDSDVPNYIGDGYRDYLTITKDY